LLVSVPNVAHNDIILKLMQDQWNYTKKGLLDETHLRFWGKENLVPFFQAAGMQIDILDYSPCPTLESEQNWDHSIQPESGRLEALTRHACGEAYQFIITAHKKAEHSSSETFWDRTSEIISTLEQQHDSEMHMYEARFSKYERRCEEYERRCEEYERRCEEYESALLMARKQLETQETALNQIYKSNFYRIATRYYRLRDRLLPAGSRQRDFIRSAVSFLRNRSAHPHSMEILQSNQPEFCSCDRIDILTPPHTLYLAKLIQKHLLSIDIACDVHIGSVEKYADIPYIILCPQNYQTFPPLYIVYQMEQTVHPRWFSENYYQILRNAYAIFDYSLVNIDFFGKNSDLLSKVFYLPVDYFIDMSSLPSAVEKSYDVLFYGDANNPRRQAMLQELSRHYSVKVCSEVFGEDVYREIRKAKVVINLHYYENALLETTRLYETLSLNTCIIVSEKSSDAVEDARLRDIVDFIEVGDCEALVRQVGYWLSDDDRRIERVRHNQEILVQRTNAFPFYFYRFLLARDRICFDQFYTLAGDYVHFHGNRICLSLPESTVRREEFDRDNEYDFEVFPGLRHSLGWVGCGLSYKFIMKKAFEQQLPQIIVCEDDVFFPDGFPERFARIQSYLSSTDDWDVFCGIMADVGDARLLDCKVESEEYFLYLDRMISMVFNIYKPAMYSHFAAWDESNHNAKTNTIDRYLESKQLRVIVTHPFLTGHKEDLQSTIWGFSNEQYSDLIAKSNCKIEALLHEFLYKTCNEPK
ncbi:MAG TPA: glycosyltransferase family 25 protein, partial [Negativicutes bacterium]|nr:glycosyltransferase family 25 protein [Negativicutes bacterium]